LESLGPSSPGEILFRTRTQQTSRGDPRQLDARTGLEAARDAPKRRRLRRRFFERAGQLRVHRRSSSGRSSRSKPRSALPKGAGQPVSLPATRRTTGPLAGSCSASPPTGGAGISPSETAVLFGRARNVPAILARSTQGSPGSFMNLWHERAHRHHRKRVRRSAWAASERVEGGERLLERGLVDRHEVGTSAPANLYRAPRGSRERAGAGMSEATLRAHLRFRSSRPEGGRQGDRLGLAVVHHHEEAIKGAQHRRPTKRPSVTVRWARLFTRYVSRPPPSADHPGAGGKSCLTGGAVVNG